MSALPVPPLRDLQEEPPRPPRRRNWRRVVAWTAASILSLILVAVITLIVLLHTKRFQAYIVRTAEQKATAALGVPIHVGNFSFNLSRLSLDIYDIEVDGAAPYPKPALLRVDHVGLVAHVTSLLHTEWYLSDLRFDHPVVNVLVDKSGADNLPKSKSTGSQQHTSIFDLGVRHALLERGEIYYNNRKSALDADLHQLTLRSAFDATARRYSGTLSYRDGHIKYGSYNPIPHDLDARFAVTPTEFTLTQAVLRSGKSEFTLNASVQDYANPKLDGNYSALLDLTEFQRILRNPSLPAGNVNLAGTMNYQSEANRPILEGVALHGEMSSPRLVLQAANSRVAVSDVAARYDIANGDASLRNLTARVLGGDIRANAFMRDIAGNSRAELHAEARGLSLAEAKSLMASPALHEVALSGRLNANADASWGKTLSDLTARLNASLRASVAPTQNAGGAALPLNGDIHANYAAATKQISFSQSELHTPNTSLLLNGTASDDSNLQVRLQSSNLHELEPLADAMQAPGKPPAGLYGAASFSGVVRGPVTGPELTGNLAGNNLQVRGTAWRKLTANVDVSPSIASLQNGELDPERQGHINFNLKTGLAHWKFEPNSPIAIQLNASQLNVADLAKAAGSQAPIAGTLSAQLAAHGSELNPEGSGRVSLTKAKIASEPIQDATLNFQGNGTEINAKLGLQMPAGGANGTLTYFPKEQSYRLQLASDGIQLDRLETVRARNMQVSGTLNFQASGAGTLQNPQLDASLRIPQLTVQNQKINAISLIAQLADHTANIALNSQAINTAITGKATIKLTGDYPTVASLNTQRIPLAPLVAMYAPAQAGNINGETELHAMLSGPLKNKSAMAAHITIPVLQVGYKNVVKIGAAKPIHVDYVNRALVLQRTTIQGTDTNLELEAHLPSDPAAPASMLVLGKIDLKILQLFDPEIASSGEMRFNVDSTGQRANPNVQGQIAIVNANFANGEMPVGLQNGNGTLTLTKDRLQITQFQGTVGGGEVTAQGGVSYRPGLRFDLGLKAHGIRLLYPDTVREEVDGNLALTGTMQNALLSGQVGVDQISFTPDFDLMSFMGQFSGETTPAPGQSFSQNLRLNLAINTTNGVNLQSSKLSLQGTANLRVQGTAAEPVVLGRVNVSGGDLIFNGNRYTLNGGTISFDNPSQTEPTLNVSADTTIQQYLIHMRFQGPADHIRTSFASDPALPPADILNLLAFGKTTEASAANPTPFSTGAESAIASTVATGGVQKITGISGLSVDPVLGGGNQNPGARLTIQRKVTSKIYVNFSTDVTSTQQQTIQLEYKYTPRLSFSGSRDQNGGFGFDVRIHKVW